MRESAASTSKSTVHVHANKQLFLRYTLQVLSISRLFVFLCSLHFDLAFADRITRHASTRPALEEKELAALAIGIIPVNCFELGHSAKPCQHADERVKRDKPTRLGALPGADRLAPSIRYWRHECSTLMHPDAPQRWPVCSHLVLPGRLQHGYRVHVSAGDPSRRRPRCGR